MIYADMLMKLYELIAKIIEKYQPLVETCYGSIAYLSVTVYLLDILVLIIFLMMLVFKYLFWLGLGNMIPIVQAIQVFTQVI